MTEKAIGGHDVCHTCAAHCAEIERLRAALKDALHEVATGYYGNAKSIITRALGSADDGSDVIATKLDTIMNADADSSAVSRE
jgi:hypothetical protein